MQDRVMEQIDINTLLQSIASKAIHAHLEESVIKNRVGKKGLSVEVIQPLSSQYCLMNPNKHSPSFAR